MPLLPSIASPMHGAVVPIAYYKVTSATHPIVLSNIPQNYQDLMIVINATVSSGNNLIYVTFNGTYPNTISYTTLDGNGSSATSSRTTSSDHFQFPSSSATYPVSIVTHILNYANTSTYKTLLNRFAGDFNGSGVTEISASLVQITSGITGFSINSQNNSDNLQANSTIEVFGIRTVNQ